MMIATFNSQADRDAELCERIRCGDRRARTEAMDSVLPWVRSLVFRYRIRERDRDDALHYVIVHMAERIERYDSERGSLTNFATLQVKSAMDEWQRREYRFAKSKRYDADRPGPSPAVSPVLEAIRQEFFERIAAGIQRIHARDREILERRFVDGQTLKEIGEAKGFSLQRAEQIQNAGLKALARTAFGPRKPAPFRTAQFRLSVTVSERYRRPSLAEPLQQDSLAARVSLRTRLIEALRSAEVATGHAVVRLRLDDRGDLFDSLLPEGGRVSKAIACICPHFRGYCRRWHRDADAEDRLPVLHLIEPCDGTLSRAWREAIARRAS